MGSRGVRSAGALVCVLGLLAAACTWKGVPSFEATAEPVIAVLCQFSQEVVLLDPDDLHEMGRIGLKSQSLEFDAHGRRLVTAQTGGHDRDVGREFGELDLESGTVAYTRLKSLDIQSVAVATSGWFMLTTGLVGPSGQALHRVSSDREVEDLFVPPGISGCVAAGDRVWISRFWDDEKGRPIDKYFVFGKDGEPRELASEMTRTVSLCGSDDAVVAFGLSGNRPMLVRHDAESGEVLASALCEGFDVGAAWAWAAGPYIALADGPVADYYLAKRLVLVDAVTLKTVGAIDVEGVSAVCEVGDGRLAVAEGNGVLSLVDPRALEKVISRQVGDPRGDMVDIELVQ